jgi:acetyltransferase-like isoleucine patch superfamily enzyme
MFKDRMGRSLNAAQVLQKGVTRVWNILLDIELYLLYLTGYVPFHMFRQLIYRLVGMKLGKGSTLHMWARFYDPSKIQIGEDTIVGDHAFLDGRSTLKIGNHVDIASSVMIFNSEHDLEAEDFVASYGEVEIGDYVFIGPRVTIMPGVKIGKGAVVAGGAIVTKNVEDYAIVGGVPAKVIGERKNKDLHYRLGRARLFQ